MPPMTGTLGLGAGAILAMAVGAGRHESIEVGRAGPHVAGIVVATDTVAKAARKPSFVIFPRIIAHPPGWRRPRSTADFRNARQLAPELTKKNQVLEKP